jgi:hypothetical protein
MRDAGFGASFLAIAREAFGLALGLHGLAGRFGAAFALGLVTVLSLVLGFVALAFEPLRFAAALASFRLGAAFGFKAALGLRAPLFARAVLADVLPLFLLFAMISASDSGSAAPNPRGVLATALPTFQRLPTGSPLP